MRIVAILFTLVISLAANFKGASGIYILKGIAYQNKTHVIRNKFIELEYGNFKEKVKTNNKGEFQVKINWEIPCMSVNFGDFTEQDRQISIALANPKYLLFQFDNKCIYIINYFYTQPDLSAVPFLKPLTFYEDLKF